MFPPQWLVHLEMGRLIEVFIWSLYSHDLTDEQVMTPSISQPPFTHGEHRPCWTKFKCRNTSPPGLLQSGEAAGLDESLGMGSVTLHSCNPAVLQVHMTLCLCNSTQHICSFTQSVLIEHLQCARTRLSTECSEVTRTAWSLLSKNLF